MELFRQLDEGQTDRDYQQEPKVAIVTENPLVAADMQDRPVSEVRNAETGKYVLVSTLGHSPPCQCQTHRHWPVSTWTVGDTRTKVKIKNGNIWESIGRGLVIGSLSSQSQWTVARLLLGSFQSLSSLSLVSCQHLVSCQSFAINSLVSL